MLYALDPNGRQQQPLWVVDSIINNKAVEGAGVHAGNPQAGF